MALGKGAYAIHQSGKWYTNENIDQMLMERHLNKKARRGSHKTYCYICYDKLIKEYDEVLVPVGHENNEVVATVESVDGFFAKDAPYPVDKCKHVIRRMIS